MAFTLTYTSSGQDVAFIFTDAQLSAGKNSTATNKKKDASVSYQICIVAISKVVISLVNKYHLLSFF